MINENTGSESCQATQAILIEIFLWNATAGKWKRKTVKIVAEY